MCIYGYAYAHLDLFVNKYELSAIPPFPFLCFIHYAVHLCLLPHTSQVIYAPFSFFQICFPMFFPIIHKEFNNKKYNASINAFDLPAATRSQFVRERNI